MLKKAVSDHRAWLRFISTMMRSRSLAEETILAGRRRGNYEQKWQKRKVFLHFLISATLGHKTVKEFGIENLCKFSQIAGGNYEEWREKIYDLFVKFFRESTLAVELWSHSEMIKLVSDLANPRFNHWLNFGKLMLSSTGECNRFTEIRQAFLKAVRLTACSIFESHKKGAIRGFVSDPVGSFNKRINALHPVSVYNALEVCPYLTAWLDDDNLFRMMAVSELLESGSQIRKLIEERNHFCWLKCSEILAKKISLAQVLQNLWSGRTFVDDFNILNHIPKPSDKWEVGKLDGDPHLHSIREILKETVFAGKLEGVYERIKDVYSFNCTLEKSSFSDEVLIALFFNFEKAKLPPDIRNSVLSLRGIKMLDDEMSAKLFKKEVAHLVKFARDKSGNGIEFEMPDEFADNTFNTEETVFTE
ncbi:hypothetical protein A2645_00530 [Candidatus Nomurabacteria bacterium RIFCSPHIGHO2_01_FULL_39_9]|uniref:Uncharacterized protein n=1 Tax=Candidatus Nomurabacteria bacterium RIFCSPHIGHO2_01_FULL_39_9 TaxID=1801735 RepID=A0A1F6UWY3_9BACT|nr:MAG: hypothetical protein A2645_00530 [Candidatus Nomurabacteria bacterium RIFCSPHIGHO2_01_FULL_39_9]